MIRTIATLLALGLDPQSDAARHLLEGLATPTTPEPEPQPEEEEDPERWDGMS